MTTSEILEKAAALIEPEGAWCQEFFAIDTKGRPVTPTTDGCAWCGEGAVAHVARIQVGGPEWIGAVAILDRLVGDQFSRWQDAPGRTQAEVVAALRDAAKAAES